jgi:hypothetical protein
MEKEMARRRDFLNAYSKVTQKLDFVALFGTLFLLLAALDLLAVEIENDQNSQLMGISTLLLWVSLN